MTVSGLPCHGCSHSDASAPPPGRPSGERPCGFCLRNPALPPSGFAEFFGDTGPLWYDRKTPPYKLPMDCYIATDRLVQEHIFDKLGEIERGAEVIPRGPIVPGGNECCVGGPAPGGHVWDCVMLLGHTFG